MSHAISALPVLDLSGPLTTRMLEKAGEPLSVRFPPKTRERVAAGRAFMLRCIEEGRPVYGATTGFGPMVSFAGPDDSADQCDNALNHLGTGQGPDLPTGVVRATILARLWSLSRGRSGVSQRVLDALADTLRTSLTPAVPELGSVGASGDLVPLAHTTSVLRGEGHAFVNGDRLPAGQALAEVGLRPLELDGRDALALVNGTSLTSAAAGLAVAALTRSHTVAHLLTALLADLLGCEPSFVHPALLEAYGHGETVRSGSFLRGAMKGLVPSGTRELQEPYSIRCTPQLLGAAGSSLRHAASVVSDDLNGVSDNPLFFAELDTVTHGGNFFGQPVAFVADLMSVTATQMGNLAERQLDLMIDPHRNGGLPPMLAPEPGRQHGVQGVQLAATAMVADMRRRCAPASMQSLPTNLHNQDVVPFGTQAALAALRQAKSLRLLHGSLAVALRQSAHVGARRPTAPRCAELLARLTDELEPVDADRPLDRDVRRAADLLDTVAEEGPRVMEDTGW